MRRAASIRDGGRIRSVMLDLFRGVPRSWRQGRIPELGLDEGINYKTEHLAKAVMRVQERTIFQEEFEPETRPL